MDRAERRRRRDRVIARRLFICVQIMRYEPNNSWYTKKLNRLSKYNLVCSCWACKGEQYSRKQKHKPDWFEGE